MSSYLRYYVARVLTEMAIVLACLAIRICGQGMVKIEIIGQKEMIDWDAVGGAALIFLFALAFWFLTP